MNDMTTMTTACATCARPVRRLRPRPLPLLLLPAWRVESPAPAPAGAAWGRWPALGVPSALAAKAERPAAASQPVKAVLVKADFRSQPAAIAARRQTGLVSAVGDAIPHALGELHVPVGKRKFDHVLRDVQPL